MERPHNVWFLGLHFDCWSDGIGVIPSRMNAANYVQILENVMLPCARQRFPAEEYDVLHFMQDNSPVHTARIVRTWFEEHPEINLLRWPSRSPDLNLIENIWSIMIRSCVSGEDRNRDALIRHTYANWEGLRARPEIVCVVCDSMPARMQEVTDNQGFWIDRLNKQNMKQ